MTTYEIAGQTHNEATAAYHAVLTQYRARTIGTDEYLAARAIYTAATAAFDAAFEAEVARLDAIQSEAEVAADDSQLSLFA